MRQLRMNKWTSIKAMPFVIRNIIRSCYNLVSTNINPIGSEYGTVSIGILCSCMGCISGRSLSVRLCHNILIDVYQTHFISISTLEIEQCLSKQSEQQTLSPTCFYIQFVCFFSSGKSRIEPRTNEWTNQASNQQTNTILSGSPCK